MINPINVGQSLRDLRKRRGLSLRALARRSGVAVSFLSKVEAGRGSPTVVTFLKILEALEASAPEFFATQNGKVDNVLVYRLGEMKEIDDGDKMWRYIFPNSPDVKTVMTYEEYGPHTKSIEIEQHSSDICGLVLSGALMLETSDDQTVTVNTGDSFYIRSGTIHSSSNRGAERLRMVVVELLYTRINPPLNDLRRS